MKKKAHKCSSGTHLKLARIIDNQSNFSSKTFGLLTIAYNLLRFSYEWQVSKAEFNNDIHLQISYTVFTY